LEAACRSHADQREHRFRADLEAGLAKRVRPRLRVRVVAVEQRPIDVQEHGFDRVRRRVEWSQSSARPVNGLRFVRHSSTTSPATIMYRMIRLFTSTPGWM
jgi:hypothetical protein